MSETTKQKIIEAGAELIHAKGFNNTGLQEILKVAGVPKGSFYFYFDSKEDFGVEVVNHYGRLFRSTIHDMLEDDSLPPLERLHRFFSWFEEYYRSHDYSRGCPVGNLGQEMGDLSPAFREKLRQAIDGMASALKNVLLEAQRGGDIEYTMNCEEMAYFIISAWHGAMIRMKVSKSGEPLRLFHKYVFSHLLRVEA
ncbi:TetR/AcrR family transcriptional regulator [Salidesulfovibrio onnuriiensis]|uniref:TetR/AcrR family transcriptional regulator n=1 Tax=Salidesulfovibrio onnuriiensis TaxID=2583823 RepID=UPI0011C985A5|nr:TetR/AcrR family transcriptional regulator [Salidesulfovibrio onnuriiensis]